MLTGINIKNLKSFANTGDVPLTKINILMGANNAGKTTFLSAIELFFRSMGAFGTSGPLAFESMNSFASFDSTLRRHWSRSEPRPQAIHLGYSFLHSNSKKQTLAYDFECRGGSKDDTIKIASAIYTLGKAIAKVNFSAEKDSQAETKISIGEKEFTEQGRWFHQLVPYGVLKNSKAFGDLFEGTDPFQLEVVNPYRPVPRSFYVLDDPNLGREDRSMLTFLLRVWGSSEKRDLEIKSRLVDSLINLGLAKKFDVAQVSKKIGPKVVEIRIAPTTPRQNVTIADAGFGLSQVLPLVAYNARLSNGFFVAYQPEVHLHPYAQSRLADLFVESSKRGNQIFVETHSPDLVLRMQALIARKEINAEDVSILCFENKAGKSAISPLNFDDSGKPSIGWPSGFLDTSLNLARDLMAARIASQKQEKTNAA